MYMFTRERSEVEGRNPYAIVSVVGKRKGRAILLTEAKKLRVGKDNPRCAKITGPSSFSYS